MLVFYAWEITYDRRNAHLVAPREEKKEEGPKRSGEWKWNE